MKDIRLVRFVYLVSRTLDREDENLVQKGHGAPRFMDIITREIIIKSTTIKGILGVHMGYRYAIC
jgi:hypothetical protein